MGLLYLFDVRLVPLVRKQRKGMERVDSLIILTTVKILHLEGSHAHFLFVFILRGFLQVFCLVSPSPPGEFPSLKGQKRH